jgi:hypothetical protein
MATKIPPTKTSPNVPKIIIDTRRLSPVSAPARSTTRRTVWGKNRNAAPMKHDTENTGSCARLTTPRPMNNPPTGSPASQKPRPRTWRRYPLARGGTRKCRIARGDDRARRR